MNFTHRKNNSVVGLALVTLLLLLAVAGCRSESPCKELPAMFIDKPSTSTSGHFTLGWAGGCKTEPSFVLEEATDSDFTDARVLYSGPDVATTISGKFDGQYYYRLRRVESSDWSDAHSVQVKHHELSTALMYFGGGFFVFLCTALIILVSYFRALRSNK